jgi:hypothetical protein
MSVSGYRLSTVQVRAAATNQPALIWTAEPDRDALSSNGVPGWFDEQGQPHEAYAHHWTHTPPAQPAGRAQATRRTGSCPWPAAHRT